MIWFRCIELHMNGRPDFRRNVRINHLIQARRHRQWSATHEDIMMKHLTLCVNLRKPHMAKDALFQYKALTQQAWSVN